MDKRSNQPHSPATPMRSKQGRTKSVERHGRLAAALRANLQKRRGQAKARAGQTGDDDAKA